MTATQIKGPKTLVNHWRIFLSS